MRKPWWLFVAACLFLASTSRAQVSVLEEGFGPARNGANLNETKLTTSNVNTSGFGLIMSLPVSGEIYAQPLVVSGVTINGTQRNALYVATMNDVVYCFDADTGAALWSVTLGTPVPTPTGNINGSIGIESTPYVNASTQTMYLVTDTVEQGNPTFRIHMLDITTGADKVPSVVIAGSVSGTGAANVSGTITFNASIENQRPGLAFANNMVFISFASYGDSGPYHGFLFAYNAQTLAQTGMFCDTPNGDSAGIWMSGRAPAVDSSGNVYLITGNGDWDGGSNFGESFLKFSTAAGAFQLSSYFTPSNWSDLNANDADMGSSGAMLIGNYVVGGGKLSVIYLLNQSDLGEEVQGDTQVPQYFTNSGGGYILSNPAFNPQSGLYYVWTGGGRNLNAYQFNSSTNLFNTSPAFSSTVLSQTGSQGGALSISANGSTAGTAIVWANIPAAASKAATDGVPGVVYAFDASTLTELWDSNQNSARDSIGNWSKFRPPVVANGKVYVGSASGYLAVYGLLPASQLSSSTTFTGTDTTTQGNWGSAYGADGYVTPTTTNTPSYAVFSVKNASVWTWASSTSDPRAVSGQANCWYSTTPAMSFDINLTDGNSHQIALYLLDWDSKGRSESISVADAATGTVLNSVSASNFANGVYYRWNVSGHVVVTVTLAGGPNAVVSGVFFGGTPAPTGTVSFVKSDTTTQGNWSASYGADGYSIATAAQSVPSYAVLTPQNEGTWTWATGSSDPRALQTSSGGVAAAWYNTPSFSFNLQLSGGAHQVALYALDWDNLGRAETVTISDATTGNLLDTEKLAGFSGGVYLVWSISGHVLITVTNTSGPNGVISGVFFGAGTSSASGGSGSGSGNLTGATILVQLPSGVTAALPGSLTIAPNQSQQITVTITNATTNAVAVTTSTQQ
jgi:hypothetical protein